MQAYLQGMCWFSELTVDGERSERILFGLRLKFVGKSNILRDIRHYTGYAAVSSDPTIWND